ncbi:uncharacterized protein AKAW2_80702A [Aspergillus luchuensis]|uniref:Uncharacterized protein n=2 Tax=Aspergillus kawachii TaxID=1069201 RepID=A0A7R8A428_ASPKA|nr:uncharacterized protein AKAW2_80702A [Aspergillus luchuensis]BCS04901.1 hypothetical protein AKAW2_80702A [Aspergillus luchuensis]
MSSVKSIPGENMFSALFNVVIALIYPYYGIYRGLDAICRCGNWYYQDPLRMAARSGALCTVVRDDQWSPRAGQTLRDVYLHAGGQAQISVDRRNLEEIDFTSTFRCREVHGQYNLPAGYKLAMLPSNASVEPLQNVRDIQISSTNNFPKAIVAVVQGFYALYTLIKTVGHDQDQIRLYGFAAYGFTPLPYLVMSAINFAGNVATPGYPTLYLVESHELDEVKNINLTDNGTTYGPGSVRWFDGTVGRLTYRNNNMPSVQVRTVQQGDLQLSCSGNSVTIVQNSAIKQSIPAYTQFDTIANENEKWFDRYGLKSLIATGIIIFILGAVPVIIIFAYTDGQAGENTTIFKEAAVLTWLLGGIVIGGILAPFRQRIQTKYPGAPPWWEKTLVRLFIFYIIVYAAPTVLGAVAVVLMMHDYGYCIALS